MHVISRKALRTFVAIHSHAAVPLDGWYRIMRKGQFEDFASLRATFGSVDKVGRHHVFDIAGNRYRLIASIHFNSQRCYIRHIMTHAEYSRRYR